MLSFILGAIGLAIVVVLLLAASKPNTFRIARTARADAPPERIFPLLNDFHNWTAWSPFEKLDPAMQRTYGGAPEGVGATYAFVSEKAGTGDMRITESVSPTRVALDLNFVKPFKTSNKVIFTLEPQDGGTLMGWAMEGPAPFMSKLMQVFFSMDKTLGATFEQGLAELKALAEQRR